MIKSANQGSAVEVCDREDHIKETKKQLGDEEVYEVYEMYKDAVSILETINAVRSGLKINIFPFAKKST